MFTYYELEAELMTFYCNDDILIDKVLLQVFSKGFRNNLVKQVRIGFVISTYIPGPVTGIKVAQLVNGRRN